MEKHIYATVRDRKITIPSRYGPIVGYNTEYKIHFDFDYAWAQVPDKMVRFIYGGVYYDRPIQVNGAGEIMPVEVPRLCGVDKVVEIGVYSECDPEIYSTIYATLEVEQSILCRAGRENAGDVAQHTSEAKQAADRAEEAAERAAAYGAKSAYGYALDGGYTGTEAEFAKRMANGEGDNYVTAYGAKGDGSTDDTAAFQAALAEERVVFVPGGTYKLTGGLVIGDNCMLELSQDTVLNFTSTSGNCLTLGMSSTLKGNHATANVPYEFTGNVLYANSADHTSEETNAVPPFMRWDPMWKSGRYVTDLNICKADSRGFHYSVNGECNGTAVYLSADGTSGNLSYMWGIHFSGLRIAGAFAYGIHAENFNEGWMHEMRVDAFIDACEIGVCLEECKNTYISAVIQPRRAYSLTNVYKPYAKHGIKLVNSRNTDLSGSRVWDWDADKTLWTDGGEYQHIAMIGDCTGTIINDFRYNIEGDTRNRIYTDYASNLEKITIIQEPITRWFKPVGDVPYFSDGFSTKKLITQTDMDGYFETDVVKKFTDSLENAIGADGVVYEGVGYKIGRRMDTDGTEVDSAYYVLTGFIPCHKGCTIYANHMTMATATGDDNCRVQFFDANFNPVKYGTNNTATALINRGLLLSNGNTYVATYTEMENGFKLEVSGNAVHNTTAYVRFVIYKQAWGTHPMVSIDNEIKYTVEGFIADGIKIKDENIEGLETAIDARLQALGLI